ncbi:hypothetical protein P154DRAFT_269338 [Amniculicola lignicola CBS 123094]|uniref:Ubiquitin-like domain-containing protein n=1 Tax=Amniculicola lignicola CBS 123094 TaxID=1392246 RepID=A0A6A5W925_9PLEO|nr:hypothetical protein P154DRAFT_269338 [Amniculicola lignicola CBS 123094]
MTTPQALPDQLVLLIIRFTASIPDLPLTVSARTLTTLSLKQLVRPHLPAVHAAARLRLIYAGKVLGDNTLLSVSLRLPPPPRDGPYNEHGAGSRGKGKQAVRNAPVEIEGTDAQKGAKKYYIHCSLGDALSANELAVEAASAQASEVTLQKQHQSSEEASRRRWSSGTVSGAGNTGRRRSSATAAVPQGFDRLLSSGFTAQEVATLRSQFQTNLSYTHTPDTMPSPTEMRAMEDRWLDSTATDPSPALAGGDAEAGWGAGFTVEEGGLDDMLFGYLTGFFWPLGALIWGFREEGVWPRRRQLAVVMGVVLNAAFGFMRWSS